jgi:hypothetical protein
VTVDLGSEPPGVQRRMTQFLRGLSSGVPQSTESWDYRDDLDIVNATNMRLALEELRRLQFLTTADAPYDVLAQASAALGRLDCSKGAASAGTVALVTDSPGGLKVMSLVTDTLGLDMRIIDPAILDAAAISVGSDPIHAKGSGTDDLLAALEGCGAVIAHLGRSSVVHLRALNIVAVEQSVPIVVGIIDGPFASIIGVESPRTGCLECFEQRSLARLEDHVSYHDFLRQASAKTTQVSAVDSLVAAFLANEAVILQALGTSRFIGRALSIYLPTYEMQAQDVLRISTCQRCGRVAAEISREHNFSSRRLIDHEISTALGLRRD